jgi:hypothetical protein
MHVACMIFKTNSVGWFSKHVLLGHLRACQNLPSDFSYGDVACKLTETTNFCINSARNIFNAANVPVILLC